MRDGNSESVEFDGFIKVEEITPATKEEKNEEWESGLKEFSIGLDCSKEFYYEVVGKYIEKFISDCYQGKYSYKEIVHILKNRLV